MSPEEEQALQRIQGAIVPFDVYLKSTHLEVFDGFDPKRSEPALGFRIRHEVQKEADILNLDDPEMTNRTAPTLRFTVKTGVQFTDENSGSEQEEPQICAQFEAVWLIEYQIRDAKNLDTAGIEAFRTNGNVMYHVWPYWREFIHASCARLRLPQVILPMFRVKQRVPKKNPALPAQTPKTPEGATRKT